MHGLYGNCNLHDVCFTGLFGIPCIMDDLIGINIKTCETQKDKLVK